MRPLLDARVAGRGRHAFALTASPRAKISAQQVVMSKRGRALGRLPAHRERPPIAGAPTADCANVSIGRNNPYRRYPTWVDHATTDLDRAQRSYDELLGWTSGEAAGPEFGGCAMFRSSGMLVIGSGPVIGGAPAWTTYVRTEDANATE